MSIGLLPVEWGAPLKVRAAFTLRSGGVSAAPWDSLNLGAHVEDVPAAVAENRRRVLEVLALPSEPLWRQQEHGTQVFDADAPGADAPDAVARPPADAAVTRTVGKVLAILVADCLPVLFATLNGEVIGAAHAGWRGLAGGVLEATVAAIGAPAEQLCAWLGPAIGPRHFEVGAEVRAAFVGRDTGAVAGFSANQRGRWQCDLAWLARRRLQALGVTRVAGGGCCTYADTARFYSFRRDGRTGRMAALIWRA